MSSRSRIAVNHTNETLPLVVSRKPRNRSRVKKSVLRGMMSQLSSLFKKDKIVPFVNESTTEVSQKSQSKRRSAISNISGIRESTQRALERYKVSNKSNNVRGVERVKRNTNSHSRRSGQRGRSNSLSTFNGITI
jgi:hypothetical protein